MARVHITKQCLPELLEVVMVMILVRKRICPCDHGTSPMINLLSIVSHSTKTPKWASNIHPHAHQTYIAGQLMETTMKTSQMYRWAANTVATMVWTIARARIAAYKWNQLWYFWGWWWRWEGEGNMGPVIELHIWITRIASKNCIDPSAHPLHSILADSFLRGWGHHAVTKMDWLESTCISPNAGDCHEHCPCHTKCQTHRNRNCWLGAHKIKKILLLCSTTRSN